MSALPTTMVSLTGHDPATYQPRRSQAFGRPTRRYWAMNAPLDFEMAMTRAFTGSKA